MGGILTGCKGERISNYNLNKGKTTEMVIGRVLGEVREKPHVLRETEWYSGEEQAFRVTEKTWF